MIFRKSEKSAASIALLYHLRGDETHHDKIMIVLLCTLPYCVFLITVSRLSIQNKTGFNHAFFVFITY